MPRDEKYDLKNVGLRSEALRQAAIAYGINLAGINLVFDPTLPFREYDDNGKPQSVTYASTSKDGTVRVGYRAFMNSSGWLGSIISHEVEVHVGMQANMGLWWTDTQGTAFQEIQAWKYIAGSADRFGLNTAERNEIADTYSRYYNRLNPVNQWLADRNQFLIYLPETK